jgi:mitogen-activated protein kinase kinase
MIPSTSGLSIVAKGPMTRRPAQAKWSDKVLEVQESLYGSRRSPTVFRVRDTRTGRIMAKKVIPVGFLDVPLEKLARRYFFVDGQPSGSEGVPPPNIVQFFGAYMSTSNSEMSYLMEYCEGGSLASIGQSIIANDAVVGEKAVGKLAEGV